MTTNKKHTTTNIGQLFYNYEKPQAKTFYEKSTFCEKPIIYFMTDWPKASREARKSVWMKITQDRRHRFKRRICQTGQQIEWCLTQSHREKMRVLCAFCNKKHIQFESTFYTVKSIFLSDRQF